MKSRRGRAKTTDIIFPSSSSNSITILGTGAKWLAALEDRQVYPTETHKLQTLHTILSTGSPLKPQSYDYVYSKIKKNVLLGSITGTSVKQEREYLICAD